MADKGVARDQEEQVKGARDGGEGRRDRVEAAGGRDGGAARRKRGRDEGAAGGKRRSGRPHGPARSGLEEGRPSRAAGDVGLRCSCAGLPTAAFLFSFLQTENKTEKHRNNGEGGERYENIPGVQNLCRILIN